MCDLRRARKLGPARIGPVVGLPDSTVHRILTRHGLHRLAWNVFVRSCRARY